MALKQRDIHLYLGQRECACVQVCVFYKHDDNKTCRGVAVEFPHPITFESKNKSLLIFRLPYSAGKDR